LQTNGTLLNDEWGAFLKEHDFLVGISIDGPPAMHDAYRVDKGGKPTSHRVLKGLDVLKRHGVEWNVLTTVHAVNGDHGSVVYRYLRDQLGASYVQFIPIIERATPATLRIADEGWGSGVHGRPLYVQDGSLVTHRSVSPEQYGRFMIEVFEEWVRHDIGEVYVQIFDTALAAWYGEGGGMCVHAETCGDQLALEHNGDLYSCDHYVEPDYLLGNIGDRTMLELIDLPQQQRFGQNKRDTLTQFCRDCDVRFACNGGCPKDRFTTAPSGEPGQHYLCPGYLTFFHHVREPMEAMTDLLRHNRPPSDLMATYARDDAARGRNEPCTCGSGMKWKQCHGSRADASPDLVPDALGRRSQKRAR
ncbi:MAG: SPASM domain-containing protein, partial [Nocardioidaceae bacterium]